MNSQKTKCLFMKVYIFCYTYSIKCFYKKFLKEHNEAADPGDRHPLLGPDPERDLHGLLCTHVHKRRFHAGIWDAIRRDGKECYPFQALQQLCLCPSGLDPCSDRFGQLYWAIA